jgi:hypothetical protein
MKCNLIITIAKRLGNIRERIDSEQHNDKKAAVGPKKNLSKELKKPNKSDEMVQVIDRYVKMKEK